jgi:RecB family exonuclease
MLERDSNYRRDLRARPIRTEHRLRGTIAGVEVAGKADRIDQVGESGLKVIDYKTGRGTKPKKGDPTRGGTTLQCLIYAELAAQNAAGLGLEWVQSAEGEYWFLGRRIQEMEERHVLDDASRARLEEFLQIASKMMREGLVPMRPTGAGASLCEYCAYRSICPAEREAIFARQARSGDQTYLRFLQVIGQETGAE